MHSVMLAAYSLGLLWTIVEKGPFHEHFIQISYAVGWRAVSYSFLSGYVFRVLTLCTLRRYFRFILEQTQTKSTLSYALDVLKDVNVSLVKRQHGDKRAQLLLQKLAKTEQRCNNDICFADFDDETKRLRMTVLDAIKKARDNHDAQNK